MSTHLQTGKDGETLAAAFLRNNGYELLARNWRFRRCEVDAIAAKGNILHFFEVKTRSSHYLLPEKSVGTAKLNKLKEAASAYLYQHPQWTMIQFNVLSIIIRPGVAPEIFLIEDVF